MDNPTNEPASAQRGRPLVVGEPAPWFTCRTRARERFVFDTVAGRYVLLCFFGSAGDPSAAALLQAVGAARSRFDDRQLSVFGVSTDPEDERLGRVVDQVPGMRFFWDFDRQVCARYGALGSDGQVGRVLYLLDPGLRVLAAQPVDGDGLRQLAGLLALLDRLPPIGPPVPAAAQAPVLVLPRVFEPGLCEALVRHYGERGGIDSGFMQEVDGMTVKRIEYGHKRRRDCEISDEALRRACMVRLHDRLVPEIERAFQFRATRMERYIVSCYDAAEQGHFRAHRDNTTKGTAHRSFAVSLFLNSGEYEGGQLRFPEYGPALYSAERGGAVVFSCSLLHEATPVTRGRRYMFLPFLYNEEGRRIRDQNLRYVNLEDPPPGSAAAPAAEAAASA